jgi:uncharacterized lipoprotein YehR (DUF1307 family)
MSTFKKVVIVLLVVVMAFSLVACGDGDNNNNGKTYSDESTLPDVLTEGDSTVRTGLDVLKSIDCMDGDC